jgi:hypothetical protein
MFSIAEDAEAFDVLYCIAFEMMDAQWLAMHASYMEFNVQPLPLSLSLSLSNTHTPTHTAMKFLIFKKFNVIPNNLRYYYSGLQKKQNGNNQVLFSFPVSSWDPEAQLSFSGNRFWEP